MGKASLAKHVGTACCGILVEVDAVVMLTSGIAAAAGVLASLADATLPGNPRK